MDLAVALDDAMAATDDKPFRLMDLPGELRNKIYGLLLCSFEPHINALRWEPFGTNIAAAKARHSIDTAILRVNSQVHREAYDVMVKTNRFVLIRCEDDHPLPVLLKNSGVQVVTVSSGFVCQFQGYVLELVLAKRKAQRKKDRSTIRCQKAMILWRDFSLLCKGLTKVEDEHPKFSEAYALTLRVGPAPKHTNPRYQDSISSFFSETTQKTLLYSFRAHIRGFPLVKVWGQVLPNLAKDVQEEVRMYRWVNPVHTLQTIKAEKELGITQFRNDDMKAAYSTWVEISLQVDRMPGTTSWSRLVAQGGQVFIQQISELELTLFLNMANAAAILTSTSPTRPILAGTVGGPLQMADATMKPDYWHNGYTYEPTTKLLAKLRYRQAAFLRSQQNILQAGLASSFIDEALGLLPGDPKIIEEKQRIKEWKKAFGFGAEESPPGVFDAILGLLGGH